MAETYWFVGASYDRTISHGLPLQAIFLPVVSPTNTGR